MAVTTKKATKKRPVKQTAANSALQAFNSAMLAVQQAGDALVEASRRNRKFAERDEVQSTLHEAIETMKRIKDLVASPPPTTVEH